MLSVGCWQRGGGVVPAMANARCVCTLKLHRNRALLNILAERLDVGMAVDLGQTEMHLVAVLLDRRAVRSILDRHELLQHIGQLVVGVGYAEDDEAFVQWREMVRGANGRKLRQSGCTTDVVVGFFV